MRVSQGCKNFNWLRRDATPLSAWPETRHRRVDCPCPVSGDRPERIVDGTTALVSYNPDRRLDMSAGPRVRHPSTPRAEVRGHLTANSLWEAIRY